VGGSSAGGTRSAARGEMASRVMGDLIDAEGAGVADSSAGGTFPSSSSHAPAGLRAMMMRRGDRQHRPSGSGEDDTYGGGYASIAPVRERASPMHDRRRSLGFLRGNARVGPDRDDDDDEYDSEDETVLGDLMQKEHLEDSLNTPHVACRVDNQDDDGYNSDADIEPFVDVNDPDYMDLENHEHVRKNDAGEYVFDYEAMDYEALMKLKEEGYYEQVGDSSGRVYRPPPSDMDGDVDPLSQTFEYDYYFRDITKLDNPLLLKPTKPDSNAMLPLKPHGPTLDDWLFAVTDHPSKYAVMERKAKHPDSKREPRPTFPGDRVMPPEEFVHRYKGYLFVTGLVPHLDAKSGEALDFEDPLHRQSIAEDVAKLFGGSSVDVCPASPTSAFIGFATKLDAKKAMMESAGDGRLRASHPIKLLEYVQSKEGEGKMTEEEVKFVGTSPAGADSILRVTGLPNSTTSAELFASLFPPGSRLEAMFGPFTNEDYFRVSPTTALINLASPDLVSKALKSSNIANNAAVGIGTRPIQVLRAKRERVFDQWVGVNRDFGASKLGKRLFVTGDVPPHEMYLSHHDMLHISGLPPTITLDDLASFFQPYSADRRDVYGSGHIVRCSQGIPTGCAYVGFELPGEIDKVGHAHENGRAILGGCVATLRPVRDKMLRRGKRETARPSRSVEELRADLRDWERHVDPEDIAELSRLGIDKGVLDEIMLTLRHHNRTFASGDQSIHGERLYEERRVGTHYRDAVRKYLSVLKSCVGTREDPGLMYEAMFRPDQEVDTGLFDIEEERIRELRKKGI
jgi:hypothetical protein